MERGFFALPVSMTSQFNVFDLSEVAEWFIMVNPSHPDPALKKTLT